VFETNDLTCVKRSVDIYFWLPVGLHLNRVVPRDKHKIIRICKEGSYDGGNCDLLFLNAFEKLRKSSISCVTCVRPSVRT
jgi:hypothetical protein